MIIGCIAILLFINNIQYKKDNYDEHYYSPPQNDVECAYKDFSKCYRVCINHDDNIFKYISCAYDCFIDLLIFNNCNDVCVKNCIEHSVSPSRFISCPLYCKI